MNQYRSFLRNLGILVTVGGLLLIVVLALQSIPRASPGQAGAEGPYPAFGRPYPPPRHTKDPNLFLTATADEQALWILDNPTQEPGPTFIPTPRVTPLPVAAAPIISADRCPKAASEHIYYRQGSALLVLRSDRASPERVLDVQDAMGLYLADDAVGVHNTDWISVSPDGRQLALVLSSGTGPHQKGEPPIQLDIYILNLESGALHLLAEQATQPVWSPDGGRIAYRSGGHLWVMDLDSDEARKIYHADTDNEHYVDRLDWSPDGRYLLFIDTIFRQETILKAVDIATRKVIFEVEHPLWFIYSPKWSPDGSHIAYTTSDGVTTASERFSNLWLIDSNGNNRRQITQDINVFTQPQWSSDGGWIAFAGPIGYERLDSNYDLWITDLTGANLKRLTDTANVSELAPVWSPDCGALYFSENNSVLKKISLQDGRTEEVLEAEGKFMVSN